MYLLITGSNDNNYHIRKVLEVQNNCIFCKYIELLYKINDIVLNISQKTKNFSDYSDFVDKLKIKYKNDYDDNFKVDYNSYVNEIKQFTNIKLEIEIIR